MIGLLLWLALVQAAEACPAPDAAMLALPLEAFDQSEGGWRSLDSDGCEGETADAMALYREVNAVALEGADLSSLLWHEGQLRAAAGQVDRAIPLLLADRDETDPVEAAYVDATIAFLRQDRASLIAARDRLAAQPQPEGFAEAVARFREQYPDYPPPVWPLNLDVVDGLILCFGQPYGEAYGCRPETD